MNKSSSFHQHGKIISQTTKWQTNKLSSGKTQLGKVVLIRDKRILSFYIKSMNKLVVVIATVECANDIIIALTTHNTLQHHERRNIFNEINIAIRYRW